MFKLSQSIPVQWEQFLDGLLAATGEVGSHPLFLESISMPRN